MRILSTLLAAGLGATFVLSTLTGEPAAASSAAPTASAASRAYNVDLSHSNILFRVKHLGVSYQWGRFDDFGGSFTIDDDPAKSSVSIEVEAASVNSNSKGRDDHLRGTDFFSVKEFPKMSFESTSVKKNGETFEITGNLTLHGVTKEVTMSAEMVGEQATRMGERAGFEGRFVVSRSDFGIKTYPDTLGDEVTMTFAIEGTKAE